mmetsp:Transcript_40624/g.85318  ORF Transcript_40624/g.85318 Transcript_40624/m.85318 type:complete len:1056 (-) Transcript_40624:209-3376(-)|eukprot:CAMPEP_0183735892 /NCGR_PEP_ID=MMETSP0737-20130205/47888_1 /TAXON_ID=385413 /ORGANISM="Thalassiosira miniscula, Strain CCMP1093" /LENGTH=1055 /DNA_ID=CAMNT_0025969757 /DNA_START=69 /DNA_END=3236 /DNA_ORIENTATION=+
MTLLDIQDRPSDSAHVLGNYGDRFIFTKNPQAAQPENFAISFPTNSALIHPKRIDHYTLVCNDAKEVAENHVKSLGFVFDSIKPINSGTVAEGNIDMLNYILHPPANKDMSVVITEGLNDDTVFRTYMKGFGQGVHHIAFEIDDIDSAFASIKESGIETTSENVTSDIISGLKQFFIAPSQAGFFIELIERPARAGKNKESPKDASARSFFASKNMAELAQSIRKIVISDASLVADESESEGEGEINHDEKKDDSDIVDVNINPCVVGAIAAIEISVENLAKAASFLIDILNFRMIFHTGEKIRLRLPTRSRSEADIILVEASSRREERKVTVMFNTQGLTESRIESLSQGDLIKKHNKDGVNGIILSEKYFTYKVVLVNPSEPFQVVRSCPYKNELHVHINADKNVVMSFLEDPANLAKWTGHKSLHFSQERKSWVETRMGGNGRPCEYNLRVFVEEDSLVTFLWPERKVEVKFQCLELASGYTLVAVTLPPISLEFRLAQMKRIISLELDLLKAIIEGNTDSVISHRLHQHIQAYHLSICGKEVRNIFPENVGDAFNGEIVRWGRLVDLMSSDFALTIKSRPQAILRPRSIGDVSAAVRMAVDLNIPLAARGSQVSHSAGGQAQADDGLLLDMSTLSSIEFVDDFQAVKVGPGAFWDEVIRCTLARGLMPPVINDYQYLSVGGTISMGGIGFMTHQDGVQAGHVKEMQVVTGLGHVVTCTDEENTDLFDCVRGGLGQCGVIGQVTIPLVVAPKKIATFKLFYMDVSAFVDDVQVYTNSGIVDMIHAFLKPCTHSSLAKIVGDERFSSSSTQFQSTIKSGQEAGKLIFFLELGCYIWGDGNTIGDMKDLLSSRGCINGEIFFDENIDFRSYITKDPPVVETNKTHGKVPHPSFATIINKEHVVELLDYHIKSLNRGDDGLNEILIMPVKSNSTLGKGHSVPMLPFPDHSSMSFFLLFLGSVVSRSERPPPESIIDDIHSHYSTMDSIRAHHRQLYRLSNALGGKRYSYDTITSEVCGQKEWKEHYGDETWEQLRAAKRRYDPYHIFCPGVKMWD